MNRRVIIFIWVLICIRCGCQAQPCELQGNWIIKTGTLAGHYEMIEPVSASRVSFSKDSLILASGFFYNTLGEDDEYPQGEYSYIYYGNKERFRMDKDSLYIYSNPYKRWNAFKMNCTQADKILLIKEEGDTVVLQRSSTRKNLNECQIKYVKAQIHDGDLSLFNHNHEVKYFDDDKLFFHAENPITKGYTSKRFNLKPGTFKEICEGFNFVEIGAIKKIYLTDVSEIGRTLLEIGMTDGRVIKSEIQNMSCPDELRLALVPILYTHQQYIYSPLPPAK
jgi:hypothetical protein